MKKKWWTEIEVIKSSKALVFWFPCSMFYIKICNSKDGKFSLHGEIFPYFGFRREHQKSEKSNEHSKTIRTMNGWRLWMPYLMFWYMENTNDEITIYN